MSQALTLQSLKKSYFGTLLKKVLYPVLPGWVDEGRKVVQGPHLSKMLKRVASESPRIRTILNAGAGEGLYSYLLLCLPGVEQVLEIDAGYNPCNRRATSPKQTFLAASLTTLPLGNNVVDLILCSEVLEHIVEDEKALDELTRVLMPHGWFLISVPTPPAVFDPAHVREGYYPRDLTALLERRSFEVVELGFCMHRAFQFFLKQYRQGWVPRVVVLFLSWIDRSFPIGQPMDLMILARKVQK